MLAKMPVVEYGERFVPASVRVLGCAFSGISSLYFLQNPMTSEKLFIPVQFSLQCVSATVA